MKTQNRRKVWYLLATVIVAILFARLGVWQLSRAAEKLEMTRAANEAAQRPPQTSLRGIKPQQHLYQRFHITGDFDYERQFLLDNRIFEGRAGYEVITPFYPADEGAVVLVNRGWVAANPDRRILPSILATDAEVRELITILSLPSKGFVSGEALAGAQTGWPKRIQFLDYAAIAGVLTEPLAVSAVLVADAGQENLFAHNFRVVANGPEKHYGYAFQWFAMLLALVAIYVYLNFIKKANE